MRNALRIVLVSVAAGTTGAPARSTVTVDTVATVDAVVTGLSG